MVLQRLRRAATSVTETIVLEDATLAVLSSEQITELVIRTRSQRESNLLRLPSSLVAFPEVVSVGDVARYPTPFAVASTSLPREISHDTTHNKLRTPEASIATFIRSGRHQPKISSMQQSALYRSNEHVGPSVDVENMSRINSSSNGASVGAKPSAASVKKKLSSVESWSSFSELWKEARTGQDGEEQDSSSCGQILGQRIQNDAKVGASFSVFLKTQTLTYARPGVFIHASDCTLVDGRWCTGRFGAVLRLLLYLWCCR